MGGEVRVVGHDKFNAQPCSRSSRPYRRGNAPRYLSRETENSRDMVWMAVAVISSIANLLFRGLLFSPWGQT